MFVAIEMGSGLGIGELLATKNKAVEALKAIIARLERESGKKLKKICTNTNNAYLCELVDSFCKKNQILHDLPPENEQNGASAHTTTNYLTMVNMKQKWMHLTGVTRSCTPSTPRTASQPLPTWANCLCMPGPAIYQIPPISTHSDPLPMRM
jgi:hypothetical protein